MLELVKSPPKRSGYELLRPLERLSALGMSPDVPTHVRATWPEGQTTVLCGERMPYSTAWPMDPRDVTCPDCLARWWVGTWEVLRHSGHLSAPWRHTYLGNNGKAAVGVYCSKHDRLRHGGLRLQRDGLLVASAWAHQNPEM